MSLFEVMVLDWISEDGIWAQQLILLGIIRPIAHAVPGVMGWDWEALPQICDVENVHQKQAFS